MLVSYRVKGKPTIQTSHSTPRYFTQQTRNHMLIERLVYNVYRNLTWIIQNLENRTLISELIKKLWHIHKMKSAIQEVKHWITFKNGWISINCDDRKKSEKNIKPFI